jgi:large subunit ribosomal protein L17e
VARSGGIRFLLHALGEGPVEVRPILAATFLHIIDPPRTRAYLHLGTDLEVGKFFFSRFTILLCTLHQIALSVITDAYGKGADPADRMRSCTKIIQLMLRTWSGGKQLVTCSSSKHETIYRVDIYLSGGLTRNQVREQLISTRILCL